MPKEKDSVWPSTHKTGAVHHIGHPLEHWMEQGIVLLRIILQVGILNHHIITSGHTNACVKGGTLSTVLRVTKVNQPGAGMCLHIGFEHICSEVARTVIHYNNLLAKVFRKRHRPNPVEDLSNGCRFVVGRNNNRKDGHRYGIFRTQR